MISGMEASSARPNPLRTRGKRAFTASIGSSADPGVADTSRMTRSDLVQDNLVSLQTHVLAEEARHPGAQGDLSWIISAISLAGKTIANKVRRARLDDVLGANGTENVQGEEQLRMDVIANEIIMRCLGDRASIAVLASEEDEEPRILRKSNEGGKYCVLFDPLDGSSNLDSAVGVGTIFSVTRNDPDEPDGERARLQSSGAALAVRR